MFTIKDHFEYSEACFKREPASQNQDLCICTDFSTLPTPYGKGTVRIVMDGMGQGDGKEAVEIAAQALLHHLTGQLALTSRSMADYLESSILNSTDSEVIRDRLCQWIFGTIRSALVAANDIMCSSSFPRPYCTFSVAVIFYRYVFTANLGDSPIYLMNLSGSGAELIPLFACHNVAGEMVASGEISEEEALHSPMASQLRLFLGHREYDLVCQCHYDWMELPQQSILLLGSDGALAQLTRQTMASIISAHRSEGLSAVFEELQLQVEESGSVDDFTLVMDWIETD